MDLSDNLLSSLPNLTELNAAKNAISELADAFGCLSRLVRLDLHLNRICAIPLSIARCIALAELSLGSNLLSFLPGEISGLTALGTLDLHTNQISDFPIEACSLRLSVLDLSNNNLTSIPPELGTMTTLRKLMLLGNPLKSLRSSLLMGPTPALLKHLRSRLTVTEDVKSSSVFSGNAFGVDLNDRATMGAYQAVSSKALCLSGAGLDTVPVAVWETGVLMTLDLSRNKIRELPEELSTCTLLEVLQLADNKIQEWPGSILASLTNLQQLHLSRNRLHQFPARAFAAVSGLRILDLTGVSAQLPPPPALLDMPHLQELHLKRMQLQDVPPEVPNLLELRILDLSENALSSIPEGLSCLTCLEELDLSNNDLRTLTPQLGHLDFTLRVLRVDGNPLRSIRRSILERGTKAVLQYLKDKLPTT
eukprot:c26852_g1_i1 orf=594-1856(-)